MTNECLVLVLFLSSILDRMCKLGTEVLRRMAGFSSYHQFLIECVAGYRSIKKNEKGTEKFL